MTFKRLALGPRLSAVSWGFIELFTLLAVLLLPFSKSAAEVGITVALVLWALRKFPWNERFPDIAPCNLSYLIFLFFVVLSLYRIPEAHLWDGFRGFVKWLQYLALFFMSVELFQSRARVNRCLAAFVVSMTALCLNGFYQLWTGRDLVKGFVVDYPGRFTRMQSSLNSPNDLAAFLLFFLPIAFFLWIEKKKWSLQSALLCAAFVLSGLAWVLTLSRAAFVGLWLAVALYGLFTGNKAVLAGSTAGPALFLFSGALRYNFFESLNLRDITVGERLRFWEITWGLVRENPLFGSGVNTFYTRFSAAAPQGEAYRGYAHNCFLQMWSEVGLLGLLAFLAPLLFFLAGTAARAAKKKEAFGLSHALWIALTAFTVQSFFDTNFYALQTSVLFWIFWGMFIAAQAPSAPSAAPARTSEGK
jgi:O-antigen ligase